LWTVKPRISCRSRRNTGRLVIHMNAQAVLFPNHLTLVLLIR